MTDRAAILARGRDDPAWFAKHVLRASPTDYQCAILRSLLTNRHTRVKSSHAIGKSAVAAMAACWFLPTHEPSKVITTAPTSRQVRMILWGEIGKIFNRSAVRLSVRAPDTQKWVIDGANWQAEGFTAPSNDPTRFQGHHSPNMLVLVDEACGLSKPLYDEGVAACLTESNSRLLSIGNPTDASTEFARSFADLSPGAFTISAFDTPNFTDFGITIEHIRTGEWRDLIAGRKLPRPYLVTPEWVAERWAKWGEESPLWLGRVMAQFPEASDDALVPLSWVTSSADRFLGADWSSYRPRMNVLGVDVARFGSDATTMYHRKDHLCRKFKEVHGADTMVVVGHIIRAQQETGADRVYIDEIGIGAGVVDRLKEQGYQWAVGVNFGGKAQNEDEYANQRAECYWEMRKSLEGGELAIADEDFAAQVTATKWKPDSKGRIRIEEKDEIKRRIGRSPDDADAVALTFSRAQSVVIV